MLDLSQEEHRALRFTGERLLHADLSEAVLRGCVFAECDLSGADLRGADLSGCQVDLVDWSGVRIDVETAVLLARSRGADVC